jgi:rubredoxin
LIFHSFLYSELKLKYKKRGKDMEFKTYMCLICGWVYDEEAGLPEEGIAPGTLWKDVPMNWTCPECGARKEDFEMTVI